MRLIDITRPVRAGMPVWPGDPPCRVRWAAFVDADGVNVAELSMSAHTGTHADAPFHVLPAGARIGEVRAEAFVGPAQVVDARGVDEIDAEWLAARLADGCERVLLHTGAWRDPDAWPERWTGLTEDAARLLVSRGVRLLGTDAPSPDAAESEDLPVHHALLGAGASIVENLLLDGVAEGTYELIALPLRLMEADASPVRAVLIDR
jgi:arylformamidase